jgi:hypothetical protein
MVETIGICEKHLLPLDENGECELCRLSDMPSKAPPARSAWWALIIPAVILLLGAAWTYFAVLSDDEQPSQQGVPPIAPAPEPIGPAATELEEPAAAEPEEPAPERMPPRSSPPSPEDIPTPDDFK